MFIFSGGSLMLGTSIGLNAVSEHGTCTAVFVAVAAVCIFLTASIRTLNRMSWVAWIGTLSIIVSGKPTLHWTSWFCSALCLD